MSREGIGYVIAGFLLVGAVMALGGGAMQATKRFYYFFVGLFFVSAGVAILQDSYSIALAGLAMSTTLLTYAELVELKARVEVLEQENQVYGEGGP